MNNFPSTQLFTLFFRFNLHYSSFNLPRLQQFCCLWTENDSILSTISSILSFPGTATVVYWRGFFIKSRTMFRSSPRLRKPYRLNTIWNFLNHDQSLLIFSMSMLILRSESIFHRCREEEVGCEMYYPARQSGSLTSEFLHQNCSVCLYKHVFQKMLK